MESESDRFMIDNHVHDEANASKIRVRDHLIRMIEETTVDLEISVESEWTDMSPSGEFEAILA